MLIEKILTYDYSKIADWMIKTGVVLLAAAIIIILGFIWLKITAKRPGCRFGYRLSMIKGNGDAWTYANQKIGRLWIRSGFIWGVAEHLLCCAAYMVTLKNTRQNLLGS